MGEMSRIAVLELQRIDDDDVWPLMLFEEDCWIVGGCEQSREQVVGE